MEVGYRYRIYPSPGQQQALARVFGCARVVYNDCLRLRDEYHARGKNISDTEVQRRVVTLAKLAPERAWLSEVASVALVQACQDARRAYRNWFDSLNGTRKGPKIRHPSPHRKHGRQSVRFTRNGFTLYGARLYVAKVGKIKVRWSRGLPSAPSSVTVIHEPDGRCYASFVVQRRPQPLPPSGRDAGIDLGLDRLVVTSDGEIIANPRYLRSRQRRLAQAQRALARKQKGSANRARVEQAGGRTASQGARDPARSRSQDSPPTGPRQPSDLRGGPGRVWSRPYQAGPFCARCGVGAALGADRREGRALRPRVSPDRALRAYIADLLGVWGAGRP